MALISSPLDPQPQPQAIKLGALSRHAVVVYFMLAYLGSWLVLLPIVLGQQGLGLLDYLLPEPLYIALFLSSTFAGPFLAAVVLTGLLDGRAGLRTFFARFIQWRVGLRWYLLAVLGYPLVYLGAALAWQGLGVLSGVFANWSALFTVYLPALLIFPALITWGEEPGWRGFALTRLERTHNPLVASLTVGLLHGLWHLPVFLVTSGPAANGPFNPGTFAFNTINILVITIIWTWVFNRAGQSILMAVLLHSASNATMALMRAWVPNFPQQAALTAIAVFWVAALVVVAATRAKLGYRPAEPPAQPSIFA